MDDTADPSQFRLPSRVFILRIWYEAPEADEREMRIQVRCVPTGETHYFQDWPTLTTYLTDGLNLASLSLGE